MNYVIVYFIRAAFLSANCYFIFTGDWHTSFLVTAGCCVLGDLADFLRDRVRGIEQKNTLDLKDQVIAALRHENEILYRALARGDRERALNSGALPTPNGREKQ